MAASVSSSAIRRSASRRRRPSTWSSDDLGQLLPRRAAGSGRSRRSRFRNSGRNVASRSVAFEVMMTIVLRKSTVRPWPSVRRPSSSSWSRTLNTSGVRLLDLVQQHHRVRPPAHGLGQLAALVVADVAGRRADQPRDGVLLHVLRHVDPHHRLLGVEQELGQRLRQLGLADAGRAEEDERADRPVGIAQAGARAADRVRHGRHRLVLADRRARAAAHSIWTSFSISPSSRPRDRDARPARHHLGDVLRRRPPPSASASRTAAPSSRSIGGLELAPRARGSSP